MNAFRLAPAIAVALIATASAHEPATVLREADLAYDDGNFERSGRLYAEAILLGRNTSTSYYNAACAYARAGNADSAMVLLDGAIERGFQNLDLLREDTDLTSLRVSPRWPGVVAACSTRAVADKRMWDGPAWETPYQDQPTTQQKIVGLSRLWATAKFSFANFDLVPELDWDAVYTTYVDSVLAAGSAIEYYRQLETMCARLQDGHTYVIPPRELARKLWSRPLIHTRLVEGRVIVIDVYGDVGKTAGVSVGDELLSIAGEPVDHYARQRVRPYQFASTPQDLDTKTYERRLLAGAEGTEVALELARADGTRYRCTLPRYFGPEREQHISRREPMEMRRLSDGVVYVALNTFNDTRTAEMFDAAFDEIAAARALVIDLRNNGGGSSGIGYRVLARLTGDSFLTSTWYTRDYRPAFRAWGRGEGRHESGPGVFAGNRDHHFDGPVVVLTSPRTFSAAEDFLVAFRTMKRGLVVGEHSGGSTGQPLLVALGCGIRAAICTKRDRFPDGTEFVGVGIQPDVVVAPEIADFRSGHDTVLGRALETLADQ